MSNSPKTLDRSEIERIRGLASAVIALQHAQGDAEDNDAYNARTDAEDAFDWRELLACLVLALCEASLSVAASHEPNCPAHPENALCVCEEIRAALSGDEP